MKQTFTLLLLLFLFISCDEKQKVRVACVGDSITYGAGISNAELNSYPHQLGELLGDDYEVINLGLNSTTLLANGDFPYIKTDAYNSLLEYKADIVFIALGTNDSKLVNRKNIANFESDYKNMISSIKESSPNCRIILISPVKAHNHPDTVGITPDYIRDVISPKIKQVAYDNSLEVIDLCHMFANYQEHLMPDKVHPSSLGASQIAQRLYQHITQKTDKFNIIDKLGIDTPVKSNFYGFDTYTFDYKGKQSIIVTPKSVAQGAPWVWRARFWGHEPQTDIALLERGFHIVYNDVADMFGSEKAVSQWEDFYTLVTNAGLNKRAALEGMSRGGLIIYNFAAKNPDKVVAVYADAPVLDLKSWPIEHGESVIPQMLEAYGFTSIEEAKSFKGNPIDKCEAIAKGGFKMLHVCGDSDVVVPIEQNSIPFIEKIKENGGDIASIYKSGIGHHPHSLPDPKPIVDFILKAYNLYPEHTTVPTPGSEYRSGAGWVEGNEWNSVSNEISQICARGKVDVLLLGNSITQGFGGEREIVTYKPGRAILDSVLSNMTWVSAGISGDRTENLLYRILKGGYEKCDPTYAILTIGINNLGSKDSAEETIKGIIACVEATKKMMPRTKIILFGSLPAQSYINECKTISESLKTCDFGSNVTYVNPFTIFTDKEGILRTDLYVGDLLHLSPQGYEVWAKEISKMIQ